MTSDTSDVALERIGKEDRRLGFLQYPFRPPSVDWKIIDDELNQYGIVAGKNYPLRARWAELRWEIDVRGEDCFFLERLRLFHMHKLDECENIIKDLMNKDTQHQADLDSLRNEGAQTAQRLEVACEEVRSLRYNEKETAQQLDQINTQVTKLTVERDDALRDVECMRHKETEYSKQLERVTTQFEELVVERDSLKAVVKKARVTTESLRSKEAETAQRLKQATAKNVTLTIVRDGAIEHFRSLRNKETATAQQLEQINIRMTNLTVERDDALRDVECMRNKETENSQQLEQVTTQIKQLQANARANIMSLQADVIFLRNEGADTAQRPEAALEEVRSFRNKERETAQQLEQLSMRVTKLNVERDDALRDVECMRNKEADNSNRLKQVTTQIEELVVERDSLKADIKTAEIITESLRSKEAETAQRLDQETAHNSTLTIERDGAFEELRSLRNKEKETAQQLEQLNIRVIKLIVERDGALLMRNKEAENLQQLKQAVTQITDLVNERGSLAADIKKAPHGNIMKMVQQEKEIRVNAQASVTNEGGSVNIETESPSDIGFDHFPLSKAEALLSVEVGDMIAGGANSASAGGFLFNAASPEVNEVTAAQGVLEPSSKNVAPPTIKNGDKPIPIDETDAGVDCTLKPMFNEGDEVYAGDEISKLDNVAESVTDKDISKWSYKRLREKLYELNVPIRKGWLKKDLVICVHNHFNNRPVLEDVPLKSKAISISSKQQVETNAAIVPRSEAVEGGGTSYVVGTVTGAMVQALPALATGGRSLTEKVSSRTCDESAVRKSVLSEIGTEDRTFPQKVVTGDQRSPQDVCKNGVGQGKRRGTKRTSYLEAGTVSKRRRKKSTTFGAGYKFRKYWPAPYNRVRVLLY